MVAFSNVGQISSVLHGMIVLSARNVDAGYAMPHCSVTFKYVHIQNWIISNMSIVPLELHEVLFVVLHCSLSELNFTQRPPARVFLQLFNTRGDHGDQGSTYPVLP